MKKFVQQEKYLTLTLWVVFFCYSICMSLIFQSVIVPLLSPDGGKLLPSDALFFDKVAWEHAKEIRFHGWSSWRLFVSPGATGNVGILSALYAIFGHDPALIIPINAGMHALGGVLIFLLARELATKKNVGIYAGLIAGTLFIIFPSALNWYGQLHKDGYAIAGTLLILLMWVKVIKIPEINGAWLWIILCSCIGIVLVGMVRPYGLTLLVPIAIGALLITICSGFFRHGIKDIFKQGVFFLVILVLLMTGVVLTKNHNSQVRLEEQSQEQSHGANKRKEGWHWQRSDWMPDKLENYIYAAARIRVELINHGKSVKARSAIDVDKTPQNINEVIVYLPRALQVAALTPFPNAWFSEISMMRMVAAGEMFFYYLCIPGILLLLRYNRKPAIWMTIYFSVAFLVILGFTIANMGTLFRVRYAYLFVVLMLGVLGWVTFLDRKGMLDKIIQFLRPKPEIALTEDLTDRKVRKNRKQAVGSGIYVMALTFLGFIGFFYRDILMAHIFGLGAELDSFFVALLIPMTIVTIICIPLGSAFIPVFLVAKETVKKQDVQVLVSGVSGTMLVALFFICLALYLVLPYVLPYLVVENEIENMPRIRELTVLALPILFFSGSVILGNAVLNAMGKVVTTSVAQLVVPIVAIFAVFTYGEKYGVQAAMIGMIVGQLINLLIVQIYNKKNGYTLIPQNDFYISVPFGKLALQYFPLIASAFFVSVAILVDTLLAMTLPEGGVSVFNLGNKVVLLVTGLVGAAISTVMLPYFSSLIAKNNVVTARRELSVFLLFITFFSVPISVVLFVWSKPIVGLIFEGGHIGETEVDMVARVMQYAVVQIPFFACNVLLLKFSTATKHVVAIVLVAVLGLIINVGTSLILMKHMGVAGIALGASFSMVIATISLVMILVRFSHVGFFDAIVLLLNWLLFLTFLLSVHFETVSGIVLTMITFLILLMGYIQSLINDKRQTLQVV